MEQNSGSMNTASSPVQGGVVRSCLSGDTLIIRPRGMAIQGAERTLHIAGIAAPRMGTRERDDEPFAFLSREFLRKLLVGREVRYRIEYTVPISAQNAIIREYVHVFLPPESQGGPDVNVSHKILAAGWARVHESGSRRNANAVPEEEEDGGYKSIQRSIQEEAQRNSVGTWGPNELLKVEHNMTDSTTFLAEWKGKEIESMVEQVRDGSMLRIRLFLSSNHHQIINLSLAGVKAPRLAGAGGPSNQEASEPFAEEARFFVESRLLQRNVRVTLLSSPPSATPTPFSVSGNASVPQPSSFSSSILIGQVMHPVGDIAQFLLASGLAKCVDWHAGMLAMDKYRLAEKAAKEKRLNIWRDYQPPIKSADIGLPISPAARTFEATVVRVISGDTIHVRKLASEGQTNPVNASNTITSGEQRIHLSSIRQPVLKDEKQAGYANEAKDLLRKRLVGKPVLVRIDYIKKEAGSDDRVFATITATTGSKDTRDIGETLISRGLAIVLRHRNGDEDRSPDWDRLMALETEAASAQRGLHSGKELSAPKYVDASESAGKANAYLSTLKRSAKVNAIVDFCASASRFKLIVPRENCKLTFVLAGIRAPRIGRTPADHDEPFSREGLEWSTEKVLQRDVDIEVFSIDKSGGFIGAMLINNRSENVAVKLVEQGLASVHYYSAETLPFGQQLIDAESRAKNAKMGMWVNHVDEEGEPDEMSNANIGQGHDSSIRADQSSNGVSAVNGASTGKIGWGQKASVNNAQNGPVKPKSEYVDLTVSDVRGDGGASTPFSFSVQILNNRIQELEKLMQELSVSQKGATPAAKSFASAGQQRVGDWVVARFSGDGQWYRGQILRNKPAQKAKEVLFVDYGNVEDVNTDEIRVLDDTKFGKKRLPAQCHPARLSFVKLYEGRSAIDAAASKQSKTVGGRQPVQTQVGTSDEYALEALERFKEVVEGQKLIANIDHRENNGTLHLTLYDPNNASAIAEGRPEACINVDLCGEGFALPDKKVSYWPAYSQMTKAIENANQEARKRHLGVFELGDPTGDE